MVCKKSISWPAVAGAAVVTCAVLTVATPPATAAVGWTPVPVPVPANGGVLLGVAAVSATNVWAVGWHNNQYGRGAGGTVVEHWQGSAWQQVSAPTAGNSASLVAVSASSATDAWAVGENSAQRYQPAALALHWDGTTWSTVSDPFVLDGHLVGVVDLSPTNAWAIGNDAGSAARSSRWCCPVPRWRRRTPRPNGSARRSAGSR